MEKDRITNGLYAFLEAQTDLDALLSRDPHPNAPTGRPAILSAFVSVAEPLFSELVIKLHEDRPDPAQELSGGIWHRNYWIEARVRETESDEHIQIIDVVDRLLHWKRFPVEQGRVKYVQKVGGTPDDYDSDTQTSLSVGIYEVVFS